MFEEKIMEIIKIIAGEKNSNNFGAGNLILELNEFAEGKRFIQEIITDQTGGKDISVDRMEAAKQHEARREGILNHCGEIIEKEFGYKLAKCKSIEEIREINKAIKKLHKRDDVYSTYEGHRKWQEIFNKCRKAINRVSMEKFGERPDLGVFEKIRNVISGKRVIAQKAISDVLDVSNVGNMALQPVKVGRGNMINDMLQKAHETRGLHQGYNRTQWRRL